MNFSLCVLYVLAMSSKHVVMISDLCWPPPRRYLPLLAKVKVTETEKSEVSPLPFVFELLLAKSVSATVIDAIMTLVENLLMTDDFKPTDDDMVINTGVTIDVDKQGRGVICQRNCCD